MTTENSNNNTSTWTPLPKFGYGFAIYPFTPGVQTNSSDSTKGETIPESTG
ncbi:150_t:CDS:1, partial [Acaulospora morrowiae]